MLGKVLKDVGAALASKTSREAALSSLPGAGLNMVMGTLAAGPKAGAAYAAGDFLLNYPAVALARKIAPGKTIEGVYHPSMIENGINLGASLASGPIVDYATQGALYAQPQPQTTSQANQEAQQLLQRQLINQQQQAQDLAPGTMYQTGGLTRFQSPIPGITLSDEVLALLAEAA
jgi:hypothetical protein